MSANGTGGSRNKKAHSLQQNIPLPSKPWALQGQVLVCTFLQGSVTAQKGGLWKQTQLCGWHQ